MQTLYAYKTSDGRFLATMEDTFLSGKEGKSVCLGAVIPGMDGNYYHYLEFCAEKYPSEYKSGATGWLEWLKESIDESAFEICNDPAFEFDLNDLTIVAFNEVPI